MENLPDKEHRAKQHSNSNDMGSEYEKIENILKKLAWFLGIVSGVVAIIILIFFKNRVTIFGSFVTIGGAFVLAGGIAGFLFAIPRSGSSRNKQPNDTSPSGYEDNTNLEEISDWLTKIIVGLTLVQFNTILKYLDMSARSIALAFSATGKYDPAFYPWAYGMIIFFMACGFAISYLWTRINFALILTVSKKRMTDIANIEKKKDDLLKQAEEEKEKFKAQLEQQERVIEQQKKELSEEKQKLEKVRGTISAEQSQYVVNQTPDLFKSDELGKLAKDQREILEQSILKSKEKTVKDPTDPQKGRWGGEAIKNNMQLSADVKAIEGFKRMFNVTIKFRDLSGNNKLGGPVAFFVHDSFGFKDNVIVAEESKPGEAAVTLTAYEAFTVGAIGPDGTELELDLNEPPGYPPDFYWKNEPAA
jgi:hypothetical protein